MIASLCRPPAHDKHALDADANPALGSRMYVWTGVLRGKLLDYDWRTFLTDLTQSLGMTAIADAVQWSYPMKGRGGNGLTIVQPITESFIALETWPDHDGAYLVVCSCKEFNREKIAGQAHRFGLHPVHSEGLFDVLSLDGE